MFAESKVNSPIVRVVNVQVDEVDTSGYKCNFDVGVCVCARVCTCVCTCVYAAAAFANSLLKDIQGKMD